MRRGRTSGLAPNSRSAPSIVFCGIRPTPSSSARVQRQTGIEVSPGVTASTS